MSQKYTTSPDPTKVVGSETERLDRLVETMVAAFFANPPMAWCYPDESRRREILPPFFRAMLDLTVPHGCVTAAAGDDAVAIWVPSSLGVDDEVFAATAIELSAEYADRVVSMFEIEDAHHPNHIGHQYLFLLAVHPRCQGKGLGSALVAPVLVECDQRNLPAYVEASDDRNRRLYERHGFQTLEEFHLPAGPPLWSMWRDPGNKLGVPRP